MSASPSERHERILADLSTAVAPLGVLVEDLTVTPAGKRRLVRVLVDRDLSHLDADDQTSSIDSLDLDAVGDVTRVISDRLDETDAMGEAPYVLEVSSPGVDRPLTLPRHFRRNVGRLVTITTDGHPDVSGRIVRVAAEGVDLRGDDESVRTVAFGDIGQGKVSVEFNRSESKEH
ncbi:ribosome maturation factor RimP [Calidifontibacter terrae]